MQKKYSRSNLFALFFSGKEYISDHLLRYHVNYTELKKDDNAFRYLV